MCRGSSQSILWFFYGCFASDKLKIEAGDIQCGIAAGVEDMFSVPMGGFNPDFHPELAEQEYYIGMGETAEILAKEGKITREQQEEFSVKSH